MITMPAARELLGAVLLAVAVGLSGCARGGEFASSSGAVKVNIGGIGIDHRTGLHYVLLRDQAGGRSLPIMVGDGEAREIMMAMHGLRAKRPQMQDLLGTVIQTTGNQVDGVVISDLRDDVYFADIYLDDGKYRIDSRPSDAIALAMSVDAPIYVSARLLDNTAPVSSSTSLPPTAEGFGLTVQELTPGLAKYFHAQPSSGLLVVAADGAGQAAGLHRGDVIERFGGVPVHSLKEFGAAVAASRGEAPVTVEIGREGSRRRTNIIPAPKSR
jgi:bifunctional DNase/RNase